MWNQQEPRMYAQQLPQAGQYAHPDRSEPSMSDIMQNLAHNCEIIKNLVQSQQVFQQETQAALGNMGTQITQLATQLTRMQNNLCELPSQTDLNLKENVSAVTLRSVRILVEPKPKQKDEEAKHEEVERNKGHEELHTSTEINSSKVSGEPIVSISQSLTAPSFASRLAQNKKEKDEKEILEDFMKNFVENSRDDELEHVLVSALSEKDAKTEENDAIREIIQLLYSGEEIPIQNLSSSMPIPTAPEQKLPSVDLCEEQELQPWPPPYSRSCSPYPYPYTRILRPPLSFHYPSMSKTWWRADTWSKKGRYLWPPPRQAVHKRIEGIMSAARLTLISHSPLPPSNEH